jgi:hypothetical protein
MTQHQLAKLWAVVSVALLYYALNSWLVSQGANEIFEAKLVLSSSRLATAMIAILICSFLLIGASLVGLLYASRATGPWHNKIPVFGFGSINTSSREGIGFQGVMLTVFSLLPALSLIHFWQVFLRGKVVTNGQPSRVASGIFDITALIGFDDPARICDELASGAVPGCIKGATFFPFIEPIVWGLLTALAVASMVVHWRAIFR